jgi:FMN phosphatase YigB (HAD superfamily)
MSTSESTPLTLADVDAAIGRGEVRHLTADVFDTVLWRAVATPSDLFLALATELHRRTSAWPHPDRFRVARIDAERRARERAVLVHGTPECTIEEIWDEMPGGVPPTIGIACELEVEAAHLRLHPGTVSVIERARAAGVPVTLVSDFYLSSAQLRTLVESAGLELSGVDVVTSSERRRNKSEGLLEDIFAVHGDPEHAVHIGDNPWADVAAARRAGARACHVGLVDDDDTVRSAHAPWRRRSSVVGSDGGRSAIVRETLVAGGGLALDPSYQFGAAVAGPLMVGFAGWAAGVAADEGASTIHCLLREGQRIASLMEAVRPDSPERVLVHASRWAIMRAAIVTGDAGEIGEAIGRRADLRAEHLVDAFACDLADARRVLGTAPVPRSERGRAYASIADDDRLREQILHHSSGLRRNALRYLERHLRLDDGPLVLCDIGWGGTIQEGLSRILRAAGHDQHIIGLYALLSPAGVLRRANGADLRCYLPVAGVDGTSSEASEIALRSPEALERINTPRLGTLLDYSDSGEPVTRPDDHDPIPESLVVAQRGVDEFCARWVDMIGADEGLVAQWFDVDGHAASALASYAAVIASPDPRLAAAVGTWPHDDVAGTSLESLAGSDFDRWARFANGVDARTVSMHEVFWVQGAASRAHSALAHQLDALARGAHPDIVAPPSATGETRIAVFPPGSELAVAQHEQVPREGGGGWLLLRFDTESPGVRSIRIDLGTVPLLVELGDADIQLDTGGERRSIVDGAGELRAVGTWVGGRWLSDRRAVADEGGHLLIDVAPELGPEVRSVSVTIACRTSPLSESERNRWLAAPVLRFEAARRSLGRRLGRRD